jgi:hypothetical protein
LSKNFSELIQKVPGTGSKTLPANEHYCAAPVVKLIPVIVEEYVLVKAFPLDTVILDPFIKDAPLI